MPYPSEFVLTGLVVVLPTLWVCGFPAVSVFQRLVLKSNPVGQNWYKTIELAPKGWGVQILMAVLEKPLELFLLPVVFAIFFYQWCGLPLGWAFLLMIAFPSLLVGYLGTVWYFSLDYGEASIGTEAEILKAQSQWLVFNDKEFSSLWKGKKIPLETAIEAFFDGKIDFKKKDAKSGLTVVETMRNRYEIFKMCINKENATSIIKDLLARVWKHDADADKADVSDVYNRGNDFYGWFLCDKMLYSVGLWDSSDESIFEDKEKLRAAINKAQDKKLDKICGELCMMKEGMEHLDLGCGWGALILHATGKYKVKSTGITLSQEQANFIAEKDTDARTNVQVINAWHWLEQCKAEGKKYDVITCLEMSEHIGVRDYQKFQHAVRAILKDDGIFYLQIAGLRRNWQYEDLIWGLFMNKYVFPGADASCPLYWDVEQLERAGWEVRSVSNEGVHYGLTIYAWYKNWCWNKAAVVAKYGERSWRVWSIFLSWSYLIAMQGSSTVYMISMTKNLPFDARSRAPITDKDSGIKDFGISRAKYWVDKDRS